MNIFKYAYQSFKELYKLDKLSLDNRFDYIVWLIVLLISTLLELASLGLIIPISELILSNHNEPDGFITNYIYSLTKDLDLETRNIYLLSTFVGFYFVTILGRIYALKYNLRFIFKRGANFFSIALKGLIKQNYTDISTTDRGQVLSIFTSKIDGLIYNLMLPMSSALISLFIFLSIVGFYFIQAPKFAISMVSFLTVFYLIFFSIKNKIMKKNSIIFSQNRSQISRKIADLYDSFKELIYFHQLNKEHKNIIQKDQLMRMAQKSNEEAIYIPRILIDLFLVIILVFLVLASLNSSSQESLLAGKIIFSVILLQRALPLVQTIYSSLSSLRFGSESINEVFPWLYKGINLENENLSNIVNDFYLPLSRIEIDNIPNNFLDASSGNPVSKLNLKSDDVVIIKGESGSGKSIMTDMFFGIRDSNISVFINNQLVEKPFELVSYCDQKPFIFKASVYENISFHGSNSTKDKARINLILETLKIDYLKDRMEISKDTISGGEAKRIGIARAFFSDKPILVLDEPTSMLDSESEKIISEKIINLNKERVVVIITHSDIFDKYAQSIFCVEKKLES